MACHIGILPEDLLHLLSSQLEEAEARNDTGGSLDLSFLRLPHPRTGMPSLFLPYQNTKEHKSMILEVQAVGPPNSRSWFLQEEVVQDGKLLMLTPIDPTFLLIPLLRVTLPTQGSSNFLPPEDLIEEAAGKLSSARSDTPLSSEDVAALSSLRCIQDAMGHVCESKAITSEMTVYRYSDERAQSYLRTKVERLSHNDISDLSRMLTRSLAKEGLMEDGKEELLNVARIRAACDLVSQYLARDVYERLLSFYDFTALDAHMRVLRAEAMALAAASMSAVEARESKGSTQESKDASGDKKRKSKESQGVGKLKKANTKGMAKLSTFFQKK